MKRLIKRTNLWWYWSRKKKRRKYLITSREYLTTNTAEMKTRREAFLVVQWLRILLATQGRQVQSLIEEVPTGLEEQLSTATAEVCMPRAYAPQWSGSGSLQLERKPECSNENPPLPLINSQKKQNLRTQWSFMLIYLTIRWNRHISRKI